MAGWTVLPDLVTANQGEAGIGALCADLLARGVGIEAGVLSVADAEAFVRSALPGHAVRVLIEPLDADPREAVAHAAAMEEVLDRASIGLEQVHHGDGIASWAVNERALGRAQHPHGARGHAGPARRPAGSRQRRAGTRRGRDACRVRQ